MMNGSEVMNQAHTNDGEVLRKLLSSWNLECLLQHFIDEGITIEVLLMIKPHHISQLMRNHRLGVQIRFEHHLERWRRLIDKPLSKPSTQHRSHTPNCCCNHIEKDSKPDMMSYKSNFDTQPLHREPNRHETLPPVQSSTSPAAYAASLHATHNTHASYPTHAPHSPYEPRLPPKLTPAPLTAPPQTASGLPSSNYNLPTTSTSTSLQGTISHTTFNTPPSQRTHKTPVFSGDDYRSPHVSVSLILSANQPKGQQLLDYYREHQTLTNAHRMQLVNLIATYFDDNDYHLSLQTSYNMEREILQLFPNESIESYRTEKRGKIYVKFCNMKRYKAVRDKVPKRKRYGSLDGSGGGASLITAEDIVGVDDEDFTMGFENWDQTTTASDVYVKAENINEEEYQ